MLTTNYREGGTPNVSPPVSSTRFIAKEQVANMPAHDPVAKGLHAFHTGLSAMVFFVQTRRQRNTDRGFFCGAWSTESSKGVVSQVRSWRLVGPLNFASG